MRMLIIRVGGAILFIVIPSYVAALNYNSIFPSSTLHNPSDSIDLPSQSTHELYNLSSIKTYLTDVLGISTESIGISVAVIALTASAGLLWRWSMRESNGEDEGGRRKVRKGKKKKVELVGARGQILYPRGLINMGNTCFMNSVLQALASLPGLYDYLQYRIIIYYSNLVPNRSELDDDKPSLPVSEALLDLFGELNQMYSSVRALRPTSVLYAVSDGSDSRRLLCYEQQDAHELFQLVSQNITKEESPSIPKVHSLFTPEIISQKSTILNTTTNISNTSDTPNDNLTLENPTGPNSLNNSVIYNGSVISRDKVKMMGGMSDFETGLKNPLRGLFAQRIVCYKCGYSTPTRYQSFDNISLTMPQQPQTSIELLLRQYITPEKLTDWTCERCSLQSTLSKYNTRIETSKSELDRLRTKLKKLNNKIKKLDRVDANVVVSESGGENGQRDVVIDAKVVVEDESDERKVERLKGEVKELEQSVRLELENQIQLIKDRDLVENATKLNSESPKLPNIKITKTASPNASKQVLIGKPPRCLCLHLNRSMHTHTGYVRKNNSRVVFNSLLDLSPYCQDGPPFARIIRDQSRINFELEKKAAREGMRNGKRESGSADESEGEISLEEVEVKVSENGEETIVTTSVKLTKNDSKEPENIEKSTNPNISSAPETNLNPKLEPTKTKIPASSAPKQESKPQTPEEIWFPFLYRLCAVVIHYGSHDSGHFVTYRRVSKRIIRTAAIASSGGLYAVTETQGKRLYRTDIPCEVIEAIKVSEKQSETGTGEMKWEPSEKKYEELSRDEDESYWYRISDDRVDIVDDVEGEVFGHGGSYGYMLFYEQVRREQQTKLKNLGKL